MQGWIKLFYQFKEWEWYGDTNMVRLFIHLLLSANYKNTKWRGMEIPRGALLTSRAKLADETGLSEREIRTCLSRLKTTNEITIKTTNKFTLITISNYDKYQEQNQESDQLNDQQRDQPKTNKRPASDQQTTSLNIKERKNIRKQEIKTTPLQENEGGTPPSSLGTEAPKASSPSKEEKKPQDKPKEKKQATMPFARIKELWNTLCPSFPKMMVLSEARKNKIRNRVEEMGGIEQALPILEGIFKTMQETPFLKGDNKRGWKASFDWIFENDKNWVKVFEGNYAPGAKPKDIHPTTTLNTNHNGTTTNHSTGADTYEARQQRIQRLVIDKLSNPRQEPDIEGNY